MGDETTLGHHPETDRGLIDTMLIPVPIPTVIDELQGGGAVLAEDVILTIERHYECEQ